MPLYFLTYDLRKGKEYKKIYDELENFNAVKVLESTWCFEILNTSASQLRNHFQKFIDKDDGLIIHECISWASFNTSSTPKDLK